MKAEPLLPRLRLRLPATFVAEDAQLLGETFHVRAPMVDPPARNAPPSWINAAGQERSLQFNDA
eukprot:629082-Pyramimonas_sp.AAC.1